MAEEKSFEELKKELQDKLEKGFVLDEAKMEQLKADLEKNGNDISQIDATKYQKKEQESPEDEKEKDKDKDKDKNKEKSSTTISDHDASEDENVHGSSNEGGAQIDDHWKEDYKREWRDWAEQNGKIFEESKIPNDNNDISFRLYDSESKKNSNEYAAEISYKGPRSVTLKGRNGQAPDSKYFEQTVAHAMKKNGPDIEFGDIKTDEFKAKLLAACYINGANPVGNVPTKDEISKWPQELQDMVNQAKAKAAEKEPKQEKTTEPEKTSKETKYQKALAEMKNLKKDIDISTMSDEDKVIYMAAAMNGAEIAIAKNKDAKLNGALKAQEAVKLSQKMDLSDEDRKAIKEGLTKYAFFEMKERLSKSKLYKQNYEVTKELTTQRKDFDRAMESDGADHEAAIENYEKALTNRFERTLAYKKDEKTGEIVERTDEEKKAYLDILRGRSAALDKQKDQTNNPRQEINKDVLKKFIDSHSQTK